MKAWKPRQVSDVIEDLGFGWAQVQVIAISYAYWFTNAFMGGISGPALSIYLPNVGGWSKAARASVGSLGAVGLLLGTYCGGGLGDLVGRRPLMLAGLVLSLLVAALTLVTSREWYLLLLCLPVGAAFGLGAAPSVALPSELSPTRYRAAVMGGRPMAYNLGTVLGHICVNLDDAYYRNLHWRADIIVGLVPQLPLVLTALLFLRESPVVLAAMGRHERAREALREMRELNGRPHVDIDYAPEPHAGTVTAAAPARSIILGSLKVLFGREMIGSTVSLVWASFALNVVFAGHSYAFPQIATNDGISTMAAGTQSMINGLAGIFLHGIAAAACLTVSLRILFPIGLAIGMTGMASFAWSGQLQQRTLLEQAIFHMSQVSPGICCTFAFITCSQLAADIYPPRVASTTVGIILGCGNAGSVVAPYIFAAFDHWPNFYIFLTGLCAATLALTQAFLRFTPWRERAPEAPSQEHAPEETREGALSGQIRSSTPAVEASAKETD
uniref:Major facilitator superfamily (MFS) profile domain-containing protein n=1 Tax=Alexandrium monilatum TaxID=311494 RepID=A0A7S4QI36_9DINO